MNSSPSRRRSLVSIVATVLLLSGAAWTVRTRQSLSDRPVPVVRERLIMGTTCRLIAVGPRSQAESALDAAWREIESVNATMSTYDPASELSRFNAAPADVDVPLSSDTLTVLRLAQDAAYETEGAFDITVRPLIRLWQEAAQRGRVPSGDELQAVRNQTGMEHCVLKENSARKRIAGLEVTLDGIAPGFAVQQAILKLQSAGMSGGLIDLGGDIACFGRPADGDAWQIAVQDPWGDGHRGVLSFSPEQSEIIAVSTSGDYRRFLEIEGRRYSHILDPRTGVPVENATSVTVIARDAVTADIRATALSVLGPTAGIPWIENDPALAALFLSGTPEAPVTTATSRFPKLQADHSGR